MITYLRRSWITLALAAVAVAAHASPALEEALVYVRSRLPEGEVWRLWTGHLTHVNGSHLLWNLAVFLPAGIWLEGLRPSAARWFYAGSALFISASLYFGESGLETYWGLSGVATGQLVLLSLLQLQRKEEQPWFWYAVLGLVGAKIVAELTLTKSVLVDFDRGVRNVPLAHIAGAVSGLLAAAICRLFGARAGPAT